ncbi:hypothetical protein IFM89_012864 [Coptis chinensis]|uniref:3'-5' exonuclease domain-containing protein n=1 Tax=Coptis chinensis TaxID=261450 RepID=A0A835LJ20_9MAGN|nr:hypothetical protein IFM89_012848 [Coptis chinensis]KAF9596665.1 hypothetical protein IFM89_012864 [Coptis chinensis]
MAMICTNSDTQYIVYFSGKTIETTVTDKASVAQDWIRDIVSIHQHKTQVIVGLDIEWRPHPIRDLSNKSATLQLCIDDKCLILQLFYMDEIPNLLKDFLGDSKFKFVGIEVGDDVQKLRNEYGLICSSHLDIRELAKTRYPGRFRRPGLKDLALEISGLRMMKPEHVCLSNWESRILDVNQIEYACIDAYASYKIAQDLLSRN